MTNRLDAMALVGDAFAVEESQRAISSSLTKHIQKISDPIFNLNWDLSDGGGVPQPLCVNDNLTSLPIYPDSPFPRKNIACYQVGNAENSVSGLIYHLNESKDQPMRKKLKMKCFASGSALPDKVISLSAFTKDSVEDIEVGPSGGSGIVIGCLDKAGDVSLWRNEDASSSTEVPKTPVLHRSITDARFIRFQNTSFYSNTWIVATKNEVHLFKPINLECDSFMEASFKVDPSMTIIDVIALKSCILTLLVDDHQVASIALFSSDSNAWPIASFSQAPAALSITGQPISLVKLNDNRFIVFTSTPNGSSASIFSIDSAGGRNSFTKLQSIEIKDDSATKGPYIVTSVDTAISNGGKFIILANKGSKNVYVFYSAFNNSLPIQRYCCFNIGNCPRSISLAFDTFNMKLELYLLFYNERTTKFTFSQSSIDGNSFITSLSAEPNATQTLSAILNIKPASLAPRVVEKTTKSRLNMPLPDSVCKLIYHYFAYKLRIDLSIRSQLEKIIIFPIPLISEANYNFSKQVLVGYLSRSFELDLKSKFDESNLVLVPNEYLDTNKPFTQYLPFAIIVFSSIEEAEALLSQETTWFVHNDNYGKYWCWLSDCFDALVKSSGFDILAKTLMPNASSADLVASGKIGGAVSSSSGSSSIVTSSSSSNIDSNDVSAVSDNNSSKNVSKDGLIDSDGLIRVNLDSSPAAKLKAFLFGKSDVAPQPAPAATMAAKLSLSNNVSKSSAQTTNANPNTTSEVSKDATVKESAKDKKKLNNEASQSVSSDAQASPVSKLPSRFQSPPLVDSKKSTSLQSDSPKGSLVIKIQQHTSVNDDSRSIASVGSTGSGGKAKKSDSKSSDIAKKAVDQPVGLDALQRKYDLKLDEMTTTLAKLDNLLAVKFAAKFEDLNAKIDAVRSQNPSPGGVSKKVDVAVENVNKEAFEMVVQLVKERKFDDALDYACYCEKSVNIAKLARYLLEVKERPLNKSCSKDALLKLISTLTSQLGASKHPANDIEVLDIITELFGQSKTVEAIKEVKLNSASMSFATKFALVEISRAISSARTKSNEKLDALKVLVPTAGSDAASPFMPIYEDFDTSIVKMDFLLNILPPLPSTR